MRLSFILGLAATLSCTSGLAHEEVTTGGCVVMEDVEAAAELPEFDAVIADAPVAFTQLAGPDFHFVAGAGATVLSVANKLDLTDAQRDLLAAWKATLSKWRPHYLPLGKGGGASLLELLERQAGELDRTLERIEAEQRFTADFINSLTEEQRRQLQARRLGR